MQYKAFKDGNYYIVNNNGGFAKLAGDFNQYGSHILEHALENLRLYRERYPDQIFNLVRAEVILHPVN